MTLSTLALEILDTRFLSVVTGYHLSFFAVSVAMMVLLALTFYLSGIFVTLCPTRCGGKSGLLYCADLVGAACGAFAALAAACYRIDRGRLPVLPVGVALVLGGIALWNQGSPPPIVVCYSKGKYVDPADVECEEWNIRAQVIVRKPKHGKPTCRGPGNVQRPTPDIGRMRTLIDGDAGIYMTEWDGDPDSLDWIRRDVTSLPYPCARTARPAWSVSGAGATYSPACGPRASRSPASRSTTTPSTCSKDPFASTRTSRRSRTSTSCTTRRTAT